MWKAKTHNNHSDMVFFSFLDCNHLCSILFWGQHPQGNIGAAMMGRSWRGKRRQIQPRQDKLLFQPCWQISFTFFPTLLKYFEHRLSLFSFQEVFLFKRCFIVWSQRKHEEQPGTSGTLRYVIDTACQWEVNPDSVFRDIMFQERYINVTKMPCSLD